MGFPPNLRELIRSSDGVTYWATDEKARRELGYAPRDMETGLRQTLEGSPRMTVTADLSGKVAAITGASSGIGEATALMLAEAGAAVSLAARRTDRIEELAKQIEDGGGRALAIETDVGQRGAGERVRRARPRSSSAGSTSSSTTPALMLLGPVIGADTSEWRRMVEVNLLGLLYCTHAALPIMGEQGSGHIVNISSVAGPVRDTSAPRSTTSPSSA